MAYGPGVVRGATHLRAGQPSRACAGQHVSRLRKALGEAGGSGRRLVSRASGYLLDVAPGDRDLDDWQRSLSQARRAREADELAAASATLEEAQRLWRGRALGGVAATGLLAAERARLEGKANVSDPDSGLVKARSGFIQGYSAQAAVNEHQVLIAAELQAEGND